MATIDFSRNYWGHALHGDTMAEKKADRRKDRIADRLLGRRRYTVLAHCKQYPRPGDRLSYPTERGVVTPLVVAARCLNPSDMFKIEILFNKNE